MEILIGAIVSLFIELQKKLTEKLGFNTTKLVILGTIFLISTVYAYLQFKGIVTEETIKSASIVFASAIAIYETFIKPIKHKLQS